MKKKKETINLSVILSLVFGFLALVAAWLVVPEVREWLNLDAEKSTASPIVEYSIGAPTRVVTATTEKNQTIYDLFPSSLGSKWEYTTGHLTEGPLENGKETTISETGHYSETVISVITGLSDRVRIVVIHTEGENYQTECAHFESTSGESDSWYVMDESRLFITCSHESANAIAGDLVHEKDTDRKLPDFVAPLNVGVRWARFENLDLERQDNSYVWYVESVVDVEVPAGKFENCYRILLYTNPDETIRYVCPGIGLVSSLYSHHGAVNDYSAELTEFTQP